MTVAASVFAVSGSARSSSAGRAARFQACLVTAVGDPSDSSFSDLAYVGLKKAERLGVSGRVMRSRSTAGYARNIRSCVTGGAGLTIGVGFQMGASMDAVATAFPHAKFAIVGVSVTSLAHRPRNVKGVLFKDEEAGYLVGYAAGLWAKERGGRAVGSVGGLEIPPVDRYIAGFQFGAARADPGIKTLNDYSRDLVVPAKCRTKALDQIAQGSVAEFQVAGRCGLGVLDAAREKGVFGIGVDTDQSGLGPWVMTSALERVDVAVESSIIAARDGSLRTGVDETFGAARGGIGYGRWSPRVPEGIRSAVARQYRLLEAGKIENIPTTPG